MSTMTITEKILARHAGRSDVHPGDNIWVDVDILLTHDVCGPGTFGIFQREFGPDAKVWDPEKLVVIPDHYIFTDDPHANRNVELLREFARRHALPHFYDVGTERYKGVCHVALPEEGFTRPGTVIFGTDSHTCTAGAFGAFAAGIGNTDAAFVLGTGKLWVKVPPTMQFIFEGELPSYLTAKDLILHVIGEIGVDGATYRALDFSGEVIAQMSMEERMTLTNMVIEAGGKNGVIAPDKTTADYLAGRGVAEVEFIENDAEAQFHSVHRFDVSKLEPTVAMPHAPDRRELVHRLKEVRLDRAYIGSCTGGKLEDFRAAARILHDQTVKIDTFIVPSTREVQQGLRTERVNGLTLLEVFEKAGARIGEPSCAACLGGPADTFGRLNGAEVCISSTNRNFPGRMGSKASQVYLASPYTVAASAVAGRIMDPREYLN